MEKTVKEMALEIAKLMEDGKGTDVCVLDVSELNSWTDYFVIATGDSTPQVKALMEVTKDKVKTIFSRLPLRQENDMKNRWNLLDYGDVVVHILHKEERETYAIEKFWNHAYSIQEDEWRETAREFSEYNNK